MIGVLTTYLTVAGGVAAGTQMARGLNRGLFRAFRGDPRGALVEVAGGLASPALTAAGQLVTLGREICQSASCLAVGARAVADPDEGAAAAPVRSRRPRRGPVASANGAA